MTSHDISSLIDQVYEASVIPEKWSTVIEKIAAAVGAFGGSLFSLGAQNSTSLASENCRDQLAAILSDKWSGLNFRAQRLLAKPAFGFLSDRDMATDEEIENHPIYRDFLRPRGLGWTAAAHIVGADQDVAIFSIDRLHSHLKQRDFNIIERHRAAARRRSSRRSGLAPALHDR